MWNSNCQYFFLDRYKALPFLPLNSHPGSECGTEGLNVSAKCLVQLVFTRKDKMKTQERSSQRKPEETHVERAELRPDAELQSFLLRLRSVRWNWGDLLAKVIDQELRSFAPGRKSEEVFLLKGVVKYVYFWRTLGRGWGIVITLSDFEEVYCLKYTKNIFWTLLFRDQSIVWTFPTSSCCWKPNQRLLLGLERRRCFLEDRMCPLWAFSCSDWQRFCFQKDCKPPPSISVFLGGWRASVSCPSQLSNFKEIFTFHRGIKDLFFFCTYLLSC